MTGYLKYVGAILGFVVFEYSIFMAILGYLLGSFLDNLPLIRKQLELFQQQQNQGNFNTSGNYQNPQDIFSYYQRQSTQYDFPTMLLALSAAIMKADGKVLKVELNYVKTFLARQFGNQFSANHLQTLKQFLDAPAAIPLKEICNDINMRMQPAVKTQLVHYLFGIAQADGKVSNAELNILQTISRYLSVSVGDYTSVKNMFYRDTESDYKILGIDKTASEDEIKKAYRKMAIKFHPDKVAQMGEEYQTGAKEKFQKVQDAYEAIKKARNIK